MIMSGFLTDWTNGAKRVGATGRSLARFYLRRMDVRTSPQPSGRTLGARVCARTDTKHKNTAPLAAPSAAPVSTLCGSRLRWPDERDQ